ncbi:type I-C CRISPR-associated protein Cas8c/Csd1 [Pseudomonas sp. SWRI74]|uniref:Type I-C CRISPR-associated protein Cas8c/Csd1 n=1 Tax=Pseudomonas azerbaijanoccidentalis TaxID=2842347 RepID=A0ABS6QYT9_9PSED|nr:type I-C CRISPR-associated protein Cas8c/Csd1 [Pseudomonas azerbaijanoccidentalis]MBV4524049.1 type I-C CRISPR-associated protein Cas8c/Csd1 [Pseudomonas azerbaijanoccidentalis]
MKFAIDRYRPLQTNLTDSTPLIIDTQANPQDILEAALQRIRASSDLLRTLHCQSFLDGDIEDIPHITHALYLLTQDGCDLLKVAQQRMLNWKAPV